MYVRMYVCMYVCMENRGSEKRGGFYCYPHNHHTHFLTSSCIIQLHFSTIQFSKSFVSFISVYNYIRISKFIRCFNCFNYCK